MDIWSKRIIRVWGLLLLPLSLYFGYQAYQNHKKIEFWQEASSEILTRINSPSFKTVFTEEMFDEAIVHRNMSIENRFNYSLTASILFFVPILFWLFVNLGKWVWSGKLSGSGKD